MPQNREDFGVLLMDKLEAIYPRNIGEDGRDNSTTDYIFHLVEIGDSIEGISMLYYATSKYKNEILRLNEMKTGDILVGMSAEAKILNEKAEGVSILPVTAIKFHDDNSAYVNIKNDNIVEEKEVELGITDGINVEIKTGLKSGDKVFLPKPTTIRFGPPEGARGMGGDN